MAGEVLERCRSLLELAHANPPIVGPDDSMQTARALMTEHGVGNLPVLDYEKVIGIISERDVLRCPWIDANVPGAAADDLPEEHRVRHWMTGEVAFLRAGDDLSTAAARMLENRVSGFPIVTEKGGLVAVITERDLVWHFGRPRPMGDEEGFTPVVDLMTSDPMVVDPENPIHHAIMLMTDHPIRHLPVVDGERVPGMLTDRSLFRHLAQARAEGVSPFEAASRPVFDVMVRPAPQVNHLFTVMQATQFMRKRDVHAVAVTHKGGLIGIFTTSDVLNVIAAGAASAS